ncbi:hypothetical protein PENTCL1PPCAC_4019 [Pristionchus entomophagus]|uniref:Uncharacterized protein n=1 Tax=Pristionchus entomophagus TaxID=358040 RepID=A0AAV5SG48_9BILA|nr:hypothetical protein PENTCL1PPCAC_4019 [Pristionchus entomophagus]
MGSMVELLRLLNIIWQSPYGWFPVAKRVAIGRLADVVHVDARTSLFEFVGDSLLPLFVDAGIKSVHVPSILTSLTMHLLITMVRKRALDAVDVPVYAVAASVDEDEEKIEEKEEWFDAESGLVPPNENNMRSCTIS